jgi:hypothetical protein
MAFNKQSNTTAKNQFVINFKSRKSDKVAFWMNPTDSFIRSMFADDIKNITKQMLLDAKIPEKCSNEMFYVDITDTTTSQETISVEDY